jgi:hypothetical protein
MSSISSISAQNAYALSNSQSAPEKPPANSAATTTQAAPPAQTLHEAAAGDPKAIAKLKRNEVNP